MGDTLQGLGELGAIGLLALLFILIYKVATPVLTAWVTRKVDMPPTKATGDLPYNDQAARTIYDVNKSLSTVAVISEQTNEILKTIVANQQEILKQQRTHQQKSSEFIDTIGQVVIKKMGT